MDNGMSVAVIRQFDALSALPDAWDHNRQYQRDILRLVGRRRKAIDLGCGTGELTRALALRCESVVGVDASGGMIAEAKKRNWGLNIAYAEGDAESYLRGRVGEFDCITSVAAFHHMDEGRMFELCEAALAPGGIFVALDLYEESGLADRVVSAAAALLNPLAYLTNTGRPGTSREEKRAWDAHSSTDRYKTLGEIKGLAASAFGDFSLERKLFWRYLLVREKTSGR
jgi:SAM-dependent methyltransferase